MNIKSSFYTTSWSTCFSQANMCEKVWEENDRRKWNDSIYKCKTADGKIVTVSAYNSVVCNSATGWHNMVKTELVRLQSAKQILIILHPYQHWIEMRSWILYTLRFMGQFLQLQTDRNIHINLTLWCVDIIPVKRGVTSIHTRAPLHFRSDWFQIVTIFSMKSSVFFGQHFYFYMWNSPVLVCSMGGL